MELFKSNVLTVDASPDEVNDEFKGLWEQFSSDDTYMS